MSGASHTGFDPRWGAVARTLHWLVAAGVVWQLATGRLAEALSDRTASSQIIHLHVQIGLLLAAVIVLRLLWRLGTKPPASPGGEPVCTRRMAAGVHGAFYLLLSILPISGFIVWDYFDDDLALLSLQIPDIFSPTADERLRASAWYFHAYAGWLLTGLLSIHIGAALWHSIVLRDGLLRRML